MKILLALLPLLVACGKPAPATPSPPSAPTWQDRAFAADVVYLGEKHDNPDHHRQQAQVIEALVQRGARPAIVLEMVDDDQQATLDALASATTPAEYKDKLAWEKSGWPDFALYEPIFRSVVTHHLKVIAGNAPKAVVKDLAFGKTPPPAELGPLPAEAERSLELELAESHCGMLPAEALAPMALAQRLRDFTLAKHAVAQPRQPKGPRAVVVAGAGHTRLDRGAPVYALRLEPGLKQLSIGLLEEGAGDAVVFDVAWFSPKANDVDHCKDFHRK